MGYETWQDGKRQPAVDFLVAGERIDRELLRRLSSLRVEGYEGRSTIATIQFRDPGMAFIDSAVFSPGMQWEIELGWLGDLVALGTFVLATCTPDFPETGVPGITIQLKDLKQPLAAYAKWRKFEGTSVRDLVRAVARDHSLDFEVDEDEGAWLKEFTVRNPIMQNGVSDDELLRRTAARFGYLYQIQNRTIRFTRAFALPVTGDARVLAWRIGSRNLVSFKPSQKDLKSDGIGAGFSASGGSVATSDVDPKTGTESTVTVTADARIQQRPDAKAKGELTPTETASNVSGAIFDHEGNEILLYRAPPETSEKTEPADTPKDSKQLLAGLEDIVDAEGELTIADPSVRLGTPVEVVGVGTRWSGRYRVVSFLHELLEDSFRTQLGFGKKMLGASEQTPKAEGGAPGAKSSDLEWFGWFDRSGTPLSVWAPPLRSTPGAPK